MLFRQLFDHNSYTFTYLLANKTGGEAFIIDPVLEKVDRYLQLIEELELKLIYAIDTHLHADHFTGLAALRDHMHCITVMGRQTKADIVSQRITDGENIVIEGLSLEALYTPGHTDDSYCFLLTGQNMLFTGDTLFIRGTGRTDFQNGDPHQQYHSIFNKLLKLPDHVLVYPGHDYKGDTVSTIGEERSFNPRLQVSSEQEYVDLMNNLDLPDPKMMDVAVPENMHIGLSQQNLALQGQTFQASEAIKLLPREDVIFVDLCSPDERHRYGSIPNAINIPYPNLEDALGPNGKLRELANSDAQTLILFCAYGERSAMAIEMANNKGIKNLRHLGGGLEAWRQTGGTIEEVPLQGHG